MTLEQRRADEQAKYHHAYKSENYYMKMPRRNYAADLIRSMEYRTSILDVGCGRGELLDEAMDAGYQTVVGVETCPDLIGALIIQAPAHDLPFDDGAFDLVTMFDVLEHLLPEDEEATLKELKRVAKRDVILTAANYPSHSMGVELHVNVKPYEEWDRVLRSIFSEVVWLPRRHNVRNETWHLKP